MRKGPCSFFHVLSCVVVTVSGPIFHFSHVVVTFLSDENVYDKKNVFLKNWVLDFVLDFVSAPPRHS